MNKGLLIGGAIFAVAALAGAGAMGFATKSVTPETAPAALAQQVAETTSAELAPVGIYEGRVTESGGFTGDVAEGAADAPVTVIEYASLTCPHCATFHDTIYKSLKETHIDTGKIRFIYRDFPLNNPAIAASIVARCGGEDRYLAFVDLFLSQQDQWTRAQDWMGELQKMARLGGLGAERINACLSDTPLGQSIIDRYRAGQDVFGVNSTPTIIVDGEKYEGAMNASALGAYIDDRIDG